MTESEEGPVSGVGSAVPKILWLAFLSSLVVYALLPLLPAPAGEPLDPRFQSVLFVGLAVAAIAVLVILGVLRKVMPSDRAGMEPPGKDRRRFAVALVSWSLAETVALFGVVLYLLSHKPLHLFPFLLVAFGVLILLAPRKPRSGGSSSNLARPDVKIG